MSVQLAIMLLRSRKGLLEKVIGVQGTATEEDLKRLAEAAREGAWSGGEQAIVRVAAHLAGIPVNRSWAECWSDLDPRSRYLIGKELSAAASEDAAAIEREKQIFEQADWQYGPQLKLKPIQATKWTEAKYRCETELARIVVNGFGWQFNSDDAVVDQHGALIAATIEDAAAALVDLGWIGADMLFPSIPHRTQDNSDAAHQVRSKLDEEGKHAERRTRVHEAREKLLENIACK